MVAKSQIERLKGPCLDLVDKVTLEMYIIARAVIGKVVCPSVLLCHVLEKGGVYLWMVPGCIVVLGSFLLTSFC